MFTVSCLIIVLLPYVVKSTTIDSYYILEDSSDDNDTFNMTGGPICVFGLEPCSITILGNIQLILFFGIILGVSAKLISDGAEMLLDLGLPSVIIGGIVLPLLGAIPDSAMIIASGSGSKKEADEQIAVGMGTLAGSTIMLLTIPWFGGLILGRVDIVGGRGVDEKCSKFTLSSLWKQGVTVSRDVTYSVIVMLLTALPYFIIQGADWYYGPTTKMDLDKHKPKPYIKYSAITTSVICFIGFFGYLIYLMVYNVAAKRKSELRRQERMKRDVVKGFILNIQAPKTNAVDGVDTEAGEKKPLLGHSETGLQKKYFKVWKVHKRQEEEENEVNDDVEKKPSNENSSEEDKEVEEPKWKIALKSILLLVVGVGLVTIFSDPMVDALSRLVDKDNRNYYFIDGSGKKKYGQYIPIPVFYLSFIITPLCSNASELLSSLIFAAKKKKVTSSMTFSQLYGAATMNNTLCLGIFAALVGIRGLTWQYSAEVTVTLLVLFIMGAKALFFGFVNNHTYPLALGFPVVFLYFNSILMIWMLEHFAGWK